MKMFLILFVFFTMSTPKLIESRNFQGYIFSDEHFVPLSIKNQLERYTPTNEEIFLAEEILSKNISSANAQLISPTSNPNIHKNLKTYFRQYVGFVDNEGNRIIWINLLWKKDIALHQLKNEIVFVSDGGSYFWNIRVNLDKSLLSDLHVNGKG